MYADCKSVIQLEAVHTWTKWVTWSNPKSMRQRYILPTRRKASHMAKGMCGYLVYSRGKEKIVTIMQFTIYAQWQKPLNIIWWKRGICWKRPLIKERDEQVSHGHRRHIPGPQEQWETKSWFSYTPVSLSHQWVLVSFFCSQRRLNYIIWQKPWLSLAPDSHILPPMMNDSLSFPILVTEVLKKNTDWIRCWFFGPTWIRCPVNYQPELRSFSTGPHDGESWCGDKISVHHTRT